MNSKEISKTEEVITRSYINHNGDKVEQELNELASTIVKFCRKHEFTTETAETVEWADGYNSALNTIEAIIMSSNGTMVVKS